MRGGAFFDLYARYWFYREKYVVYLLQRFFSLHIYFLEDKNIATRATMADVFLDNLRDLTCGEN